jgi:SAM-dependent methyltransferase
MTLNPPTQYADDGNLRARQRLWDHQDPAFDLAGWVLDVAGVEPVRSVIDVGCGNGMYLRAMRARGVDAIGCDLSIGMLRAAGDDQPLLNGDAARLPVRDAAADVVLAPHMLDHVPDRAAAVHELRRVLRSGGTCVAVTNGSGHTREVKDLVELAVRTGTPGWTMRGQLSSAFSLENGAEQLAVAFDDVTCVRPADAAPIVITDAGVVADYVASVADHYDPEVDRPWRDVVDDVRQAVQHVIGAEGRFVVHGDPGAFVCR